MEVSTIGINNVQIRLENMEPIMLMTLYYIKVTTITQMNSSLLYLRHGILPFLTVEQVERSVDKPGSISSK